MIHARPRALLFDWDNTLIDSWVMIHHALAATLRAMGMRPWTVAEARLRVRRSARDSFPELFGDRAEEATRIFYRSFEARHLEGLRARPDADRALALLSAAGYYLAVVSNKRGDLLRREAEALGWTGHFERLVGANDASRDKPAVEAVALALAGSGLEMGPEIWFVGDTDVDMLCACNAGCVPVLLRPEAPGAGEFAGARPVHHVISCTRLSITN